jgi:hypothetical protein
MLPIFVYLAAMFLPLYLLIHFREQAWYWHVLAIAAAFAVGFIPIPTELQRRGYDLLFGFTFVALFVWGAGGIVQWLRHTITAKKPLVR